MGPDQATGEGTPTEQRALPAHGMPLEMDEKEDRGIEGKEVGDGTQRALGYLEFLT